MSDDTIPVDVTYDVVVVGGGASGKSAALAAAQGGLSVALLEKQPETGGTSAYAEGMAAFESSEQKARGIPAPGKHFPTKEEGFRRYTDYSHHRANPDVVRMQVENTAESIDIYKSLGIVYTDVDIYAYDQPYELYTFHRPDGLGARCQEVLLKAIQDAGVDIFTSTPATDLIVAEGRVVGVVAQDIQANTLHIACRAVVLASGGFGNNPDLVEKYSWLHRTAHDMYQCVPTANTGDGLLMALRAGADTEALGTVMIQVCARGKTLTAHASSAGAQPVLWVNKTARRFASEEVALSFADTGNEFARQPGATVYAIIDQDTVQHLMEEGSDIGLGDWMPFHAKLDHLQAELDEDVTVGRAWRADTIEGLATAAGLDPAVLTDTIAKYNDACAQGADPEFFKPARFLRPVATAPFYAINMTASVLVSCGGLRVNGNMQVTDSSSTPIPGLYAVGVEASGLFGDTYNLDVPGTMNGFAHASGRVAGRHIAATLSAARA